LEAGASNAEWGERPRGVDVEEIAGEGSRRVDAEEGEGIA